MPERKICVVTGSRADYGLLFWPMKAIQTNAPALRLQLVVTGSHCSAAHGLTWRMIEQDGFGIDFRADATPRGDAGADMAWAIGEGVKQMAKAYEALRPDVVMVLGDRYEILAAVQAALVMRIPVAHIAGGDVTEGAYDDAIRHAISKMAQVHFVTHERAAQRLRQLGEDPSAIHVTGSPGIDYIRHVRLLQPADLEQSLGVRLRECNAVITFHPVTWGQRTSEQQLQALLDALGHLDLEWGLFFTGVNADNGYQTLRGMIEAFVEQHSNAVCFDSLGSERYLSLVARATVVIGNSSSGLYEAPSLGTPTVNIGDRQQGRPKAVSVIDCEAEAGAIGRAISQALALKRGPVENPYGDGFAAARIVEVLRHLPDTEALLRKRFHDLDA